MRLKRTPLLLLLVSSFVYGNENPSVVDVVDVQNLEFDVIGGPLGRPTSSADYDVRFSSTMQRARVKQSGQPVLTSTRISVKYAPGTDPEKLANSHGMRLVHHVPSINAAFLDVVTLDQVDEKIAALRSDKRITRVEREILRSFQQPH